MKKLQPHSAGFTLVEMLMYMGLLSIFVVLTSGILISFLEVRLEAQATSGVEQDGRYILSRLAYDAQRATDVTAPAVGASSNGTTLMISGDSHTYVLNDGNLEVTHTSGTIQLNSSDTTVTSFTIQRLANTGVTESDDTLKMSITLESNTVRQNGAPEIRTFETTVGTR